MRIALFGATGTIGSRVLAEAVGRGHRVTGIARDPTRLNIASDLVTPARGDATNPDDVARLTEGHDALVVAIAPPRGPGAHPSVMLRAAAHAVIDGLKRCGTKRFIYVGGAGSLLTADGKLLLDTPEFPEPYRDEARAHRDVLEIFRHDATGAGLQWTFFSPPAEILPGGRTGKFRVGDDVLLTDDRGHSRISTEDYAIALIDELETPRHLCKRFTVAY